MLILTPTGLLLCGKHCPVLFAIFLWYLPWQPKQLQFGACLCLHIALLNFTPTLSISWFQALFKWFKTPAIAEHDCKMIAKCLKVVGVVALNEELSWQMIDSNNLITCLEDGGLSHDDNHTALNCFK